MFCVFSNYCKEHTVFNRRHMNPVAAFGCAKLVLMSHKLIFCADVAFTALAHLTW